MPLPSSVKSVGTRQAASNATATIDEIATVFGSAGPNSQRVVLPIARHTGIRNRPSYSSELVSALALCVRTTSTRCLKPSGARVSTICSTISAPITRGCRPGVSSGASSTSPPGSTSGKIASDLVCDSST